MISISTLDYFGAGFESLHVLHSTNELEAYRDLPLQFAIADYVNGHRDGPETHSLYPAGMLYEYAVIGAVATRDDLEAAVAAADASASKAGFGVKGERMFKLVLVTAEDGRLWVRVGNRWQE